MGLTPQSVVVPGMRGPLVLELQQLLRKVGYADLNPSGATGYYGAETTAMVAAFQRAQGWTGEDADGVPGPGTLTLLLLAANRPPSWTARHCNVQGTDSDVLIETRIRATLHGCTVVTWNELKRPRTRKFVESGLPDSWRSVVRGELGVSWRNDLWEQVAVDYVKVHGGVRGVTPERGVLSVLLKHRASNATHWHMATHVVHHIDVGGRPRVFRAIIGQNARGKKHFQLLADTITRLTFTAPVQGSGDLNVDYIADKRRSVAGQGTDWFPYTVLSKVAKLAMPAGGTHGSRAIDWGWHTGAVRVTRCRTLAAGSSDHNPVEYTTTQ